MTTQPIIKCPRGFAYGYVPIDSLSELNDMEIDCDISKVENETGILLQVSTKYIKRGFQTGNKHSLKKNPRL